MNKRKSRKRMIDGQSVLRLLVNQEQRYLEQVAMLVQGKNYSSAAYYEATANGVVVAQNIVKNFLKG